MDDNLAQPRDWGVSETSPRRFIRIPGAVNLHLDNSSKSRARRLHGRVGSLTTPTLRGVSAMAGDVSETGTSHGHGVVRPLCLNDVNWMGHMLQHHPRVRSKTLGRGGEQLENALSALHNWQPREKGAPHPDQHLQLGETADSKQVTARGKRAVSGQRTVEFAQILCFVRQGTLNSLDFPGAAQGQTE